MELLSVLRRYLLFRGCNCNCIITAMTLERVVDKIYKEKVEKKNIYVHEENFLEEQILRCKQLSYFQVLYEVICLFLIRG